MTDEPSFTLDEAVAIQRRLRAELGLGEERFEMPDLVQMIGDEIAQLRQAGTSDQRITDMIEGVSGQTIDAAELARLHEAMQRRRG